MKFKLIINGSGVRKLDELALINAINDLANDPDCFLVLEPKMPIENNIYLQVINSEDDSFLIETRFILSSDKDFKHYHYLTTDIEEVKIIFLDYFNHCKLPPIHQWIEDGEVVEDDCQMIKYYKEIDGKLCYFECWDSDEDELTLHEGIVGEVGDVKKILINGDGLTCNLQMLLLQKEYQQKGYIPIDDYTEIIIQYKVSSQEHKNREKLEKVEGLMNECLGWTGNGHCEGGHISDNNINIFCYVVEKDIAFETIAETLRENDLFEKVEVAYADETIDSYLLIYPLMGTFNL